MSSDSRISILSDILRGVNEQELIIFCYDHDLRLYRLFTSKQTLSEKFKILAVFSDNHNQNEQVLTKNYKWFGSNQILRLSEVYAPEDFIDDVRTLYYEAYRLRLENTAQAYEHCFDGLSRLESLPKEAHNSPSRIHYSTGKFHLLIACLNLQQHKIEDAAEHFRISLTEFTKRRWRHIESLVELGLAIVQRKLQNREEALDACEKAFKKINDSRISFPVPPDLLDLLEILIKIEKSLVKAMPKTAPAAKSIRKKQISDKVIVKIDLNGDQKSLNNITKNDLTRLIAKFLNIRTYNFSRVELKDNILSFALSRSLAMHFKSLHDAHTPLEFELKRMGNAKIDVLHINRLDVNYIWNVPVLNHIYAGHGPIRDDYIEYYVKLIKDKQPEGLYYIVVVQGNSLIEDEIYHGDRVLIRSQEKAEPENEIAALLITTADNPPLGTLKRYEIHDNGDPSLIHWKLFSNKNTRDREYIVVIPENADIQTIRELHPSNMVKFYPEANLEIVGKYIDKIREESLLS